MHKGKTRQDPVSCQSCRSKKLKCSRDQPCSNCAARGITCHFAVQPPPRIYEYESASTAQSTDSLLARIERLERTVLHLSPTEPIAEGTTVTQHSVKCQAYNHRIQKEDVALKHQSTTAPAVLVSENTYSLQKDESPDRDSQVLENVLTRADVLLSPLSNSLSFTICSLQNLVDRVSLHQQIVNWSETSVQFPPYNIATILFASFESHINFVCPIVHVPTVRSLMKTSYLRIHQRQTILPNQAALLLSILATGAFFSSLTANDEIYACGTDPLTLAKVFMKSTLDVLDNSRRSTSGAIEDVQACVIMSIMLNHLDGFSARGRRLAADAITISKDLRLHRLDANDTVAATEDVTVRSLTEREVKRRVFWFIASYDWLLSTTSGPQEGTYYIHPKHINVQLPKDCTDGDMLMYDSQQLTTTSQPSSITFLLAKVQLAYLCREMTDTLPLGSTQYPYESVIGMDQNLQQYLTSLPYFFQSDTLNREKSKVLEQIYPFIPIWRYCLLTAFHSRRCKLHQRFLLRQAIDPRYEFSRRACLESARAVIGMYRDVTMMLSLGMAVHFTHLALAVLVMDLCVNKASTDRNEVKADVKAALEMFEVAKDVSPLSSRCLTSLEATLLKHGVDLTDTRTVMHNFGAVSSLEDMPAAVVEQTSESTYTVYDPSLLDEFWFTALGSGTGPEPDSTSWDNLFSALDSRSL